jgi:hypothetical protein
MTPDDEVKIYKKSVKGIVQLYMNSFPGINEKAKNRSLNSLCSHILQGQMPDGASIEIERYEKARRQIQYRMELQRVATWAVFLGKLKAPRACHQVSIKEVLREAERKAKMEYLALGRGRSTTIASEECYEKTFLAFRPQNRVCSTRNPSNISQWLCLKQLFLWMTLRSMSTGYSSVNCHSYVFNYNN